MSSCEGEENCVESVEICTSLKCRAGLPEGSFTGVTDNRWTGNKSENTNEKMFGGQKMTYILHKMIWPTVAAV